MKRLICILLTAGLITLCSGCHSTSGNTQGLPEDPSPAFSSITGRITYIGNDLRAFQVYRIDSLQEMDAFFMAYFPVSTLQYPSPLEEFFAVMNAEFFEEQSLLMIYCPETEGSTYRIAGILAQENEMRVQVQKKAAASSTEALMGFLLGASVSKAELGQNLSFIVDVIE